MKHLILFCFFACLFSFNGLAQSGGAIKVTVLDAANKEPLFQAMTTATSNGDLGGGTTTDMEGIAKIKPLKAGTYTVTVTYIGYKKTEVKNVVVKEGKMTEITVKLEAGT